MHHVYVEDCVLVDQRVARCPFFRSKSEFTDRFFVGLPKTELPDARFSDQNRNLRAETLFAYQTQSCQMTVFQAQIGIYGPKLCWFTKHRVARCPFFRPKSGFNCRNFVG